MAMVVVCAAGSYSVERRATAMIVHTVLGVASLPDDDRPDCIVQQCRLRSRLDFVDIELLVDCHRQQTAKQYSCRQQLIA